MKLLQLERNPSPRDLRLFAVLFAGMSLLVAHGLRRHGVATGVAGAVAAAGGLVAVTGLARPPWVRWVYLGLSLAAYPVGWVVSHLLLAGVYYLLVTPIGLLRRLGGADPLRMRRAPPAGSLWLPGRPAPPPSSYFRQF